LFCFLAGFPSRTTGRHFYFKPPSTLGYFELLYVIQYIIPIRHHKLSEYFYELLLFYVNRLIYLIVIGGKKMAVKAKKMGRPRKEIKKNQRIAARITQELYDALQTRAYQENKVTSTILVEALIKYLDFKMPPRLK
jgi:hypothetical protein